MGVLFSWSQGFIGCHSQSGRLRDQACQQRLATLAPFIQLITATVIAPEDRSDGVPDKPEHVRLAAGAVA
jgi:hypothetical protein